MPRYLAPPSYEPTESGYEERPEEIDRDGKIITTSDRHQLYVFERIARIHPTYIEPWGEYPRDLRLWWRRSPEGARTAVLLRLMNHSVLQFQIEFDTRDVVNVQIPLDSWRRRTCDPESVRAAIQQAFLNATRGEARAPSVVNPNYECLTVMSHEEYDREFRKRRPAYLISRRNTYQDNYNTNDYSYRNQLSPQTLVYRRAGSSRSRTPDYEYQSTYYYATSPRGGGGGGDVVYAVPRKPKKGLFQRLVSW